MSGLAAGVRVAQLVGNPVNNAARSTAADASSALRSHRDRLLNNGQHDSKHDATGMMRCPDGHSCENHSVCVENEFDEGSYYCE